LRRAGYRLQIVGGTSNYGLVRSAGTVDLRPHGGRLRSARVTYAGRRAHIVRGRRWHARIDLHGVRERAVRVRVVARTRSGRTLRETRTYRTCATKRPG
jgi:hypothetical protein